MKNRILIIAICAGFLLTGAVSHAEMWYKTNQATVSWDPVATLESGEAIPATDVVRYNVFVKDRKTNAVVNGQQNILETQSTVTVDSETFSYVGVQALRYVSIDGLIPENEVPLASAISWSSDPAVCLNGEAFGIRNHLPPGQVQGLRVQ